MATNPELADLIEAGLMIETPDQLREEKREAQVRQVRVAVAGHPDAAIRRILLYVAAVALVISPLPLLGLIPLLILGLTDQLA